MKSFIENILVDECDRHLLENFSWKIDTRGYVQRPRLVGEREILLHRAILGPSIDMDVDHKNGNKLDNRRENLRLANDSQNHANQKKNSHRRGAPCTSRFKGVCWNKVRKKWQANIKGERGSEYLGLFKDEVAAAITYDGAARLYFGEFARPNFPTEGY